MCWKYVWSPSNHSWHSAVLFNLLHFCMKLDFLYFHILRIFKYYIHLTEWFRNGNSHKYQTRFLWWIWSDFDSARFKRLLKRTCIINGGRDCKERQRSLFVSTSRCLDSDSGSDAVAGQEYLEVQNSETSHRELFHVSPLVKPPSP